MFKPIKTERLLLRSLTLKDAEALFSYRSLPEVSRFQGWAPTCLEEAESFIKALSGVEVDTSGTWFQLGIEDPTTGRVIGDLGLHFPDHQPQQAEFGISLHPEVQGRGFATEVAKAALGFFFEELNKHRVFASVDPRNSSSVNLLKRLGLRQEAHHIESYFDNGEWTDDVIFAVLKREWPITAGK